MSDQNAMQIKEKIITFIRLRGPSLPVHISKETGLSILFASAFLSELFHEKKIKISNLKIGSSPLYFIPGQESQLEKFSNYLKSKEKEAFIILKEKKFLKDADQEPSIRVALREIKDFAIPFKREEEIYWRYFIIPETELKNEQKKENQDKGKELGIFDKKSSETLETKKIIKKKSPKKKAATSKKRDDNFFNKIKEFLNNKNIEIRDIQGFDKNSLTLKVNENNEERLLIAYNKKRIIDTDLIRAHKKALDQKLPYILLSLGEPPKKLNDLILAIKDLSEINKIE